MKCTTTREQLLTPLTHVEKSAGKNLSVPVLGCTLLEVTGSVLTLTATNLEVGVRYSISVADVQDGRVAVPGTILSHVVSSLPNGTSLTLETEGGYLAVTSAGGSSRISLQNADEFPDLPVVEGGTEVVLPAKTLMEALSSVAYCASNSTIKPELSSVFVHPNGGVLTTVATDSFRLAEKNIPLKQQASIEPFLIPARSVQDLLRVLEQAKDMVTLLVGEHQLSITHVGVYLTMRLTAGTFPDYTAIIPKDFMTEAVMLGFDIERVLKKASAFSDQFNQTTIVIEPLKKQFTVHTENTTVGETTDTVAAALTGDELTIRFNQRYLIEAFTTIATDSVVLQFSGQSTPAIVRPVGDESFLYLVMPMNR